MTVALLLVALVGIPGAVITTILAVGFGALGGWLRERVETAPARAR